MSVNDDLLDALTRHQIGLQRLSTATVNKVLAQLRRMDPDLVKRLTRDDLTVLSRTRTEALLRDVRRIIASAFEDATGALQLELGALAEYEGQYQGDLFKRVVPIAFETVTPSAEQLVAATMARPFQGRLLKDVYRELPEATFRDVRNSIRAGIVEGRTTGQIVRDIRGTSTQGFKDGILGKSRRNVETVVRTAVNHTAQVARETYYESNDDLVKGVRWNARRGGGTSSVCRARDGQVYETGKGPRPPAHMNCRSSTSPVLKSWRELGIAADEVPASTRASMNGQVPSDQTYDEWLRKQANGFQDDVLGPSRAKLFRGGLKMDRFVDRKGSELTLDQLRKRESELWETVNIPA